MRTLLRLTLGLLVIVFATPSPAQTPVHFWSQRFGSSSNENGKAVAVDAAGNVFVTGYFGGTANFGGGNLVSAGGFDMFLAKYNASGAHQWSQRFGGTGLEFPYGLAVDGSGNVVVTGLFQNTVNLGGANLVSAGAYDMFLAKYSASGAHLWSQRFGSTGDDIGQAVAVDAPGNLFVTGAFSGTVNFGGANLVGAGFYDVFVARYNSSGVHQWSQRFGSTNFEEGHSIALDASNNVMVVGHFNETVNFGGANLVSAGFEDIFVARYNASGVHQWSQRFGGVNSDGAYGVAVDGSGNVFVTGIFQASASLGGTTFVSAGSSDTFLAKYNSGGAHQWSKGFGNTGFDVGNAVAVDPSGNVVMAGYFNNTVNFGGADLVSAGGNEIVVAKYNAGGTHQWSQRFGSTTADEARGIAVDGSGRVVVTGIFNGTVDFGGGNLVSAGTDIFVAKYGENAVKPLVTSIADIGNDQGKRVRIKFSSSDHDAVGAGPPVTRYEAFRRIDPLPAAMAASPAGSLSREQLLDLGWVQAAEVSAHAAPAYVMDAPTDADSTIALGQHYSVFFVRAATDLPGTFYDSPIDSGYSRDNLAPGVPTSFAYAAGQLSWNESSAADFDYFSVYGSNSSSFGSATLVDYAVAPTLDVTASAYVYYFVTATDFSGNEGKPAVVNTLSGAGGTPARYVLSVSAYPNPFNPETTVRYTVPAKGRVTLEVFDAHGAHVATLIDAETVAGAYTVTWNGHDLRGNPAGSGVYFARLTSPAGTRSYKMTLLK